MPKRSNKFQKLIFSIEKRLAPLGAIVTESKAVKERGSDVEREIDIAIESNVGHHETLFAIECRDHRRRQSVEWIDSLIGKYRDLPVDKVIAVSSSGFTKPALEKARNNNITTSSFEDLIDAKLIPNDQKRCLTVEILRPQPPDVDVWLKKAEMEEFGEFKGDIKHADIIDNKGGRIGRLFDVLGRNVGRAHHEMARMGILRHQEGPLPDVAVKFPDGTKIISEEDIQYTLEEANIKRNAKIEKTDLEFTSHAYMGFELLSGEIVVDGAKVSLLLVYDGGPVHTVYWEIADAPGPFVMTFN